MSIFFVLAFLLSWLPWPLVLLNPDSSPMVPFGPLLAAVAAAALSGGYRSVGRLLGQLRHWRVSPRWYLTALLVPLLITWLAAAVTMIMRGVVGLEQPFDWAQAALTFASTIVVVGLFEEVGWRGYALPALQRRRSSLQAALLVGAAWGAWHLPLLISDPSQQRPALPFLILVLAQSVFFSWLYTATVAGLALVILSHAAVDLVARYALPQFSGTSYQHLWWCLTAIWVLVAILAAINLRHPRTHPLLPRT